MGVTSIVKALAKDEPKSIKVRWEGVVNQNSGDHQLWGKSGRRDDQETKKRATGEAERPGEPGSSEVKGRDNSRRAACGTTEPRRLWRLGGP